MRKSNNTKNLIIIAIVLVAGAGGAYFVMHNQAQAPAIENPQQQSETKAQAQTPVTPPPAKSISPSPAPKVSPTKQLSTGDNEPMAPDIQVVEIDYDGSQYTPSTVSIKVNDYVFFKNKSNVEFWPASNPHPTHTDYPAFDAKKPIAAGGEYKFQFTKVGVWGFHDNLNPVAQGKITVGK